MISTRLELSLDKSPEMGTNTTVDTKVEKKFTEQGAIVNLSIDDDLEWPHLGIDGDNQNINQN